MTTLLLTSHSPQDTARFAEIIAAELRPRDVLLLTGDLGAGKTTFTKALCAAMGVVDTVTSPTFTLVHEYRGSKLVVCHADLYRLERTGELADLGLDDARRSGAVLVVEWGDLAGDEFTEALTLTFAHAGETERVVTVASRGTTWGPRVTRLFAALGQNSAATRDAGSET
jgi:tRNA threonylcarbamoyladenosine biosynthesis protein TsaE